MYSACPAQWRIFPLTKLHANNASIIHVSDVIAAADGGGERRNDKY